MKRKIYKLCAMLLSLILLLSGVPLINAFATDIWDGTVATSFQSGTGTQADPYQIANGAQLAYLAQRVNANSTYSTAKYFKLTSNIVLNNAAVFTTAPDGKITGIDDSATPNIWTPIGIDASKPFFGSFDGDGYSVSGMYVTYNETTQKYNGLFGKIGLFASVTNLSVENSYINCIKNCAAVVAFAEDAEVTNCTSNATVIGGIQSGGVIGKVIGGVVRDCTNEGFVDSTISYCGGVIGYNEALSTIGCVNNGTVTGAGIYIGGVVGYVANNPVYDCTNNGDVTSTAEMVGGICGAAYNSSVSTNVNYGNITGPKNVGGVIGKVIGENGSAINNINRGAVVCAGGNAGGITGYGDSFFCVNDVGASVSGVSNVGGVTGYGIAAYGCNNGSIIGTGSNIGGIVGKSDYMIKYCYNTGTISAPVYGTIAGSGTAEYCYYLDTTGDNGLGDGSTVGVTALSLAEMSIQENYVGWNFNERWCFVDDSHYPRLVMNHLTGGTVQADAGFASGSGLESDPYVIETIGQLAYLSEQVNNGNTYANTYFVLNNDIRSNTFDENWGLTAVSWNPIGNRNNMFHGHFDGQGHTVSGIYINRPRCEQGLFGITDIGCIKNLTIADSHIFGSVAVGGIVGNALESSIHKCVNSATVSGCTYVGGVLGHSTSASLGDTPFNYNRNTGDVTGLGNYVGGVAGYLKYHIAEASNYGTVIGRSYVGGIAGYGGVMESYNAGTVTAKRGMAGGITGYSDSTKLNNCYNSGYVSADDGNEGPISPNGTSILCYYIEGSCDTPGDYGTKMLTAEEGALASDYIGFDFYTTWDFSTDLDYPYPILVWTYEDIASSVVWDGTVDTGYASGTGSASDPYIIETAEQLAYFAAMVNSGSCSRYKGRYFTLANDIVLNDTSVEYWQHTATMWTPIGTSSTKSFSGVFDGADYTISGIFMDENISNYGLFGYLRGGTVINLNVSGAFIRGASNVGGIAGIAANSSHISFCTVDGIVANGYQGYSINTTAGGIVGHISASTVDNCSTSGAVVGTYCGGIVGKSVSASNVYECTSNAKIFCMTENAGGIIGCATAQSDINNCDFLGDLWGVKSGGIVGSLEKSYVYSCTNDGTITDNASASTVGGIVGVTVATATAPSSITDCINDGFVSGYIYVGGIVGRLDKYADVTGCSNTGEVTGYSNVGGISGYSETDTYVSSSFNSGLIEGEYFSGGIVGSSRSSISSCANSGEINGSADNTGGISGFVSGSSETSNCLNTGPVAGDEGAGGIAGVSEISSVTCSVNYGSVSGKENIAPIAGLATETISEYNYYIDNCMEDADKGSATGATALTAEQVGLEESYEGLDFYDIWTIKNGAATLMTSVTAVDIPNALTVDCGETQTLKLTVIPESAEYLSVTWESSAPEIVSVDEYGAITALALGTAKITVTLETDYSSYSDNCAITVECLSHKSTQTIPAVAASCNASGLTEGKVCLLCGATVTTQQTIPATGHNYGEWTSCNNGSHMRNCLNDSSHTETVTCTFESNVTPPTCTEAGYTTHTCIECGYSFNDTNIPALMHDYSKWESEGDGTHTGICSCDSTHTTLMECTYNTSIVAPTCELGGYTRSVCKLCGYETIQYTSEATGHNYGEIHTNGDGTHTWVCTNNVSHTRIENCAYSISVTAPTCSEQGYTTFACENCSYSYKTDYTEPLGHDWSNYESLDNGTHMVICANDSSHTQIEDCYDPDPKETAGTCESGIKTTTSCVFCGYIRVFVHSGTETDHDYQRDSSRDIMPTQNTPGSEAYTCSSCGGHKDVEILALSEWHVPVSEITISSNKEHCTIGERMNLTATINPDNASYKSVVWKSSAPSIAHVDENGEVIWHNRGTATFTATSTDPYVPASGSITMSGGYSYATYTVNFVLTDTGTYAVNGTTYTASVSLTFNAGDNIVFAGYESDIAVEGAQTSSPADGAYTIEDIHGNATVTITPNTIPTVPEEPANSESNFFDKVRNFFNKLFSILASLFGG